MFLKKFKQTSYLVLLTLFILPINAFAYSDYILAPGENIGLKISTNGVIVVGTYKVNDQNIAEEAGFKKGDIILKINNKIINNIDEMVEIINSNSSNIEVTYKRDEKINTTELNVIKDSEGVYKTGLYVKDSLVGIGTLTFIDPNTKLFGALGHEVIEQNTGIMLEVKDGKIFSSNVTSIDRSSNGEPGAKNATLNQKDEKGTISENTKNGIFGEYEGKMPNDDLYKVVEYKDIKKGPAEIITVLEGTETKKYSINIVKINAFAEQKTKNILFEITDEELLEKTGGVVQGMSGSPIIQNGNIIGAVTHVVVNHPEKGYGIFITNMLEEAEN